MPDDKDDAVMRDDARAQFGRFDAVAAPQLFSGERIKGAQLAAGVYDEFIVSIDLHNGGRVP
jgi:hypothetical protein